MELKHLFLICEFRLWFIQQIKKIIEFFRKKFHNLFMNNCSCQLLSHLYFHMRLINYINRSKSNSRLFAVIFYALIKRLKHVYRLQILNEIFNINWERLFSLHYLIYLHKYKYLNRYLRIVKKKLQGWSPHLYI